MEVRPSIVRPEENASIRKAKSGRIRYATHGCRTCSRRFAGERRPCFPFSGIRNRQLSPASYRVNAGLQQPPSSTAPTRIYTPVRLTPHRSSSASTAIANAATPSETIERSLPWRNSAITTMARSSMHRQRHQENFQRQRNPHSPTAPTIFQRKGDIRRGRNSPALARTDRSS